jgi:hypothetical protein
VIIVTACTASARLLLLSVVLAVLAAGCAEPGPPADDAPQEATPGPTTPTPASPAPTPGPSPTPSPTPAPTPSPTPPPPAEPSWPVNGSTVSYSHRSGTGFEGYSRVVWANATLTFSGGRWNGVCRSETYERVDYGDGPDYNNTTETRTFPIAPLRGPVNVAVGNVVRVEHLAGCGVASAEVVVAGRENVTTNESGRPVTRSAWVATELPGNEAYEDMTFRWDAETGLLLQWSVARLHSSHRGFGERT